MDTKSGLGPRDLVRLSHLIGRPVTPLRPYESILAINVNDAAVSYSTQLVKVTETTREMRFTGAVLRIYSWHKSGRVWEYAGMIEMVDDTFAPYVVNKTGKIVSYGEWRDQRNFERDCYRPGSGRAPLDNFDRSFNGLPAGENGTDLTPAPMKKHWSIG